MNTSVLFRSYPQLAWTLLRITSGLLFIPHAWFKLSNLSGAYAFFAKCGFPAPEIFVWLALITETLAAVGLIFNLYVRWAALLGAGALFGAVIAVFNLKGGFAWLWNLGGFEYPAFWCITCVVIALVSPGVTIKNSRSGN